MKLYIKRKIYHFDEELISELKKDFKNFLLLKYKKKIKNGYSVEIDEFYRIRKMEKVKYLAEGYTNSWIYYGEECGSFYNCMKKAEFGIPVPLLKDKKLSFEKKALFVDRDGVLIRDTGYPKPDDVEFLKETEELLKLAFKRGYIIVVVSNQSGIGRGILKKRDVELVNRMIYEHYKKLGVEISDFFYSPYHVDSKIKRYKRKSLSRKPEAGMILESAEKYGIKLNQSIMVGDKESDRIKLPYLKFFKFPDEIELLKQFLI